MTWSEEKNSIFHGNFAVSVNCTEIHGKRYAILATLLCHKTFSSFLEELRQYESPDQFLLFFLFTSNFQAISEMVD